MYISKFETKLFKPAMDCGRRSGISEERRLPPGRPAVVGRTHADGVMRAGAGCGRLRQHRVAAAARLVHLEGRGTQVELLFRLGQEDAGKFRPEPLAGAFQVRNTLLLPGLAMRLAGLAGGPSSRNTVPALNLPPDNVVP